MYLLKYIVPDSDIQAPGRNKQHQLSYSVVGHVNYKIYVLDRKYPFSCKSGITSMALASLSDWIWDQFHSKESITDAVKLVKNPRHRRS